MASTPPAKRLGLVAGYAAPYEPPRDPGPGRHLDAGRPGELIGIDCFDVGKLRGTEGAIWPLTAIDVASSFGWAELIVCKQGNPTPGRPRGWLGASPPSCAMPAGG